MIKSEWISKVQSLEQIAWNLGLIGLGCFLCAVSINGILIPHQFLSGGFTGIVLVIHYIWDFLSIGWLYFLLNIPVFALGWMYVGRRFFLYSVGGMIIFSAAIAYTDVLLPVHDKILSSLLAGILTGIGSGIILKSLGSAGGLDILSVIFCKRFSVRLGTTILIFNSIVLLAAALLFSLENALYTLIYMYVTSNILNVVVTGLSQRKAIFIISLNKWQEISKEILAKTKRGMTIIKGEGGYSGKDENILYAVVTFRELSIIKQIIRSLDPDAFVVVTDTLEVMGHRIGNQPHW